jgi:adenine-specific DNA-methyltransferase
MPGDPQRTFNLSAERLSELRALVPEAFADGELNWAVLRELLGDYPTDDGATAEPFGLHWPGKREARRLADQPSQAELVPVLNAGINEATTGNLVIEGDNLEALRLLQPDYAGQVKLIYIDPPYNTGNGFAYNDTYSETRSRYRRRTAGHGADGLDPDAERIDGRRHAAWLSMIYPRLQLARNLLREDGLIAVSIDDHEVHHLRLLLNEVFGEDNFLVQIIVQSNKRGQTYRQIAKTHEYLLVYTLTAEGVINEIAKTGDRADLNREDALGPFNIRELRNRNPKFGRFNRPNLFYPIYVDDRVVDADGFSPIALAPDEQYRIEVLPINSGGGEGCWRWGRERTAAQIGAQTTSSNVVARRKRAGGYNIYEKYRKATYKAKSIWLETEMTTERGTADLRALGLADCFEFPKPVALLQKLLLLGTEAEGGELVLDFFAGSGTLAQALLELNREDGGDRRFMLVQSPEPSGKPELRYALGDRDRAHPSGDRTDAS